MEQNILMEIYQPAEDSNMFAAFLKKYLSNPKSQIPNPKFLDMGTGSGILAKTASKFIDPKNILAVDINPDAVKALQKEKFKVIQSNLFQAFNKATQVGRSPKTTNYQLPTTNYMIKFDLIVFNAPYLPLDKREPKSSQLATTGGKFGDEISLKFLKQAKVHLNKNGKVFLLISSLTPQNKIKKLWPYKIVARKKIFMEELLILEFH
ncbi:methyltransferase [Methanococcoides sp. SA1]|nr:methyltransferase [Methanococcoides sp. SA1]